MKILLKFKKSMKGLRKGRKAGH